MSESLLPYYNRELAALRRDAGEFAQAFPKVAGRLRLSADIADDPYVERLLEGVAFLAARVQHRLDDELPEISDALLEMLSPQLLAPVPSMTTLRLRGGAELRAPVRVPRGLAVESEPVRGEPVRFRTCHDVTLWPLVLDQARLSGLPIVAPPNPAGTGAMACLRLSFRTSVPDLPVADLGLDRLRLHLRGAGPQAALLHELLCQSVLSVAVADGPADAAPTLLGAGALRPAGFEPEEAALPWPRRAFAGHRLLTEWFAFPEKFLYLDLEGLEARSLVQKGDRLEVFIWLSRAVPELERVVTAESFALGCTPAINLFPQRCEPVALDGTRSEWIVVPDARRPAALEVHSIEEVRESRPDGSRRIVLPFHRLGRAEAREEVAEVNYLALRRPALSPLTGTQTALSLRDVAFDPAQPADAVLSIDALCCNRDLPAMLPFGGGQPRLTIAEGGTPVASAECLSAPTPTLRPELGERSAWKLVSHLAMNHLGVTGGGEGALALREILRLHDLRDSAESRAAIAALVSVDARPGVARLPGGRPGAFVRGLEVTLGFDPGGWQGGGLHLLAAVLERFLALQVSVNAFVRTAAVLRGRPGLAARWAPRSGTRVLL
ncbi:type VI secretion system baseplate subunit TssF [Roseomonas sp. OT10]|uniref:type VI secretion system baseplate subunit TssF n=1 Tax=Roseomonas cutis TaxID=2897332 RepID=UPI001E3D715C|nr:type VI secretion system baseplate subunit TssF [Roseomonas sp. OT10]UFN47569.1 type VI secretion system baseplate subunit TssF [Roseomonas sp. OT10]